MTENKPGVWSEDVESAMEAAFADDVKKHDLTSAPTEVLMYELARRSEGTMLCVVTDDGADGYDVKTAIRSSPELMVYMLGALKARCAFATSKHPGNAEKE